MVMTLISLISFCILMCVIGFLAGLLSFYVGKRINNSRIPKKYVEDRYYFADKYINNVCNIVYMVGVYWIILTSFEPNPQLPGYLFVGTLVLLFFIIAVYAILTDCIIEASVSNGIAKGSKRFLNAKKYDATYDYQLGDTVYIKKA